MGYHKLFQLYNKINGVPIMKLAQAVYIPLILTLIALALAIIMLILGFATGTTQKIGEPGPQGPGGAKGSQGDVGSVGPQGPLGPAGAGAQNPPLRQWRMGTTFIGGTTTEQFNYTYSFTFDAPFPIPGPVTVCGGVLVDGEQLELAFSNGYNLLFSDVSPTGFSVTIQRNDSGSGGWGGSVTPPFPLFMYYAFCQA